MHNVVDILSTPELVLNMLIGSLLCYPSIIMTLGNFNFGIFMGFRLRYWVKDTL